MKKLVALLLFCCTLLACFGCTTTMGEVKPVTCEEVIQAYENAGYYVRYYEQEETSDYYCYMNITKKERGCSLLFCGKLQRTIFGKVLEKRE